MATFVPGHNVGDPQFGYTKYEKPHWANAAGRWVKPPPKPKPPKRPVRRTVYDPFAAETEDQTRARVRAMIQEGLGPILDSITKAIEARSQSGMAAIGGLTKELGGLFSQIAPQTGQYYGAAKASDSAINTALADRLGSFGKDLGAEIGNKISYAPAAVQQQIAGGAQQTAQGVANANFAKGSAGLEMLNAHGAAAQAYGAKMPGIAGLTGVQNARNLQASLSSELARQLADARASAESDYTSAYERERDRELQKAIAKQSGLQDEQKIKNDADYKRRYLKYQQDKARYDRALKLQQLGITQERVSEYARHNGISEAQAEQRLIQQRRRDAEARRHNRAGERERKRHNKKTESKKGGGGLVP